MSDEKSPDEKEQAKLIIEATVRNLAGKGRVSCRDDVIRYLLDGGFDMTHITAESITLCAPGDRGNPVTLTGYLFSEQFMLNRPSQPV